MVTENQEQAYNLSISNQYSIFSAKAIAIKAALDLMKKEAQDRSQKTVIITDSRSVLDVLINNKINVYRNCCILEIRKLYFELTLKHSKRVIFTLIPI